MESSSSKKTVSNGSSDDPISTITESSSPPQQQQQLPEESPIPIPISISSTNSTSSAVKRTNSRVTAPQKPIKKRVRKQSPQQREYNAAIKYGSLFLLVAQMVGLVLLMRYSRTRKGGELYLASTAVFMMETMKLAICLVVVFYQSGSTFKGLKSELHEHVWMSPYEVLKLCVPSLLYTVQNNLLYLALTNLDAATYQVCYQLKILTTALFSAVLLKRQFSLTKWTSLIILTVGVAIVQLSGSSDQTSSQKNPTSLTQNRFLGLTAVLCAACTSGFSGVYFEKILKGSKTSLWLRNIQMGLPSILIAYLTVYIRDSPTISTKGFFIGYTPLVWTVVTIQAAGGLIVAVVVKYADNVLKVFATSFSIIVSCVISAVFFEFRPNLSFCVGTVLVVMATVMYSKPEKRRRRRKEGILPLRSGGRRGDGMKII